MAGSYFGTLFKITTWGESHGKAMGVVVDGCPAGLSLCEKDIQVFLDRRKPGKTAIATQRKEADEVEILSGVFEGRTTGAPISLIVRNTSQISADYTEIASCYRPGHADYCFDEKYGFRDYRGGGRSSGRETTGRVAAGAIASKILNSMGIELCAYTKSLGHISIDMSHFEKEAIVQTATAMPDRQADALGVAHLEASKKNSDSVGGVIECRIKGVPTGFGDPVFEKLDANLAKAIMSIGAIKAVEIGDGILVTTRTGSENNDLLYAEDGIILKRTNHSGGISGGISDGGEILLRAHVKPTASIFRSQETVNREKENITIKIDGRHDPVIVPRAVVVVECMSAIVLLDALLVNMSSRLDHIMKFYEKSIK